VINVAILGAGAIADTHIQAFQQFPELCRIAALVDLYPEKANEKAARYGLDAEIYTDASQLAARGGIDLVSICLPPFAHAEAAVTMLEAGVHVLTEKPMATSLEECDRMIAAADSSGRLLSVVAQNRYLTPMLKLKQVLASGIAGRIVHAQVESYWWRGLNYYSLWWRGTWEKEGGGCTMNHAVHHIDLFQWMMGMPTSLQAVVTNLAHNNSEVEDFSTAVLFYPDGAVGQVTASLVHHGEEQQMVFQGERARISVPWKVVVSQQRENGFPQEDPALAAEIDAFYQSLPDLDYTGHAGQIRNVLKAIAGEEGLLIDGREGRKTLELVMAIYQSSTLGGRVSLPLGPESPFYTRAGVLERAPHFYEKTSSVENFADETITLGREYGKK
jgi:UDP-N-acetyl-2-amino-2-deoxyglucuronate dehydrogenase